jgi:hypothetical protein
VWVWVWVWVWHTFRKDGCFGCSSCRNNSATFKTLRVYNQRDLLPSVDARARDDVIAALDYILAQERDAAGRAHRGGHYPIMCGGDGGGGGGRELGALLLAGCQLSNLLF